MHRSGGGRIETPVPFRNLQPALQVIVECAEDVGAHLFGLNES